MYTIASVIIPLTRIYVVSMSCFFAQGLAQAMYDMVGNNMILNLWSGISTSPINAMHAGYGIGAILAVQASKNYIVFSVYDSFLASNAALRSNVTTSSSIESFNSTTKVVSSDKKIDLKIPYFFAALIASVLTILFLIAQLYERKVHLTQQWNVFFLFLKLIKTYSRVLRSKKSLIKLERNWSSSPKTSNYITRSHVRRRTRPGRNNRKSAHSWEHCSSATVYSPLNGSSSTSTSKQLC